MKKYVVAACMTLLLIGGGIAYSTPIAYLSVDINPSVELAVNALDRVVDVQTFNEDGEAVMEGLDVENLTVDEAVSQIVDAAADQGYIEEDGSSAVALTAATDDQEEADELTKEGEEGVLEALEENELEAEVSMAAITEARRAAALEAGISPGKMNLIQKLWEAQNPETTIEAAEYSVAEFTAADSQINWVDAPVKDIMKAIKATRNGEELEAADSDSAAGDADKHGNGKGKGKAAGQQLRAGTDDDDQDLTSLNAKVKKNTTVDSEEEEVEVVEEAEAAE